MGLVLGFGLLGLLSVAGSADNQPPKSADADVVQDLVRSSDEKTQALYEEFGPSIPVYDHAGNIAGEVDRDEFVLSADGVDLESRSLDVWKDGRVVGYLAGQYGFVPLDEWDDFVAKHRTEFDQAPSIRQRSEAQGG